MTTTIIKQRRGPGCLVQALWFFFIGWWLGGIVLTIAWLLNLTIVGLPLGMMMLNYIPKILALQEPELLLKSTISHGSTTISEEEQPQLSFILRSAYFLLIGWWWSGIWLTLAYLCCALIVLLPVGLGMFRMTPAMTTLKRY
ncbi:MAG: YccF domain-containing protein [Anaerolineales bacterium]|nr:YccF domain-containing protein [Anaerolineales bacterium]